MSTSPQENEAPEQAKQNDKEQNFAQLRQLLERERLEKQELASRIEKAEKMIQERERNNSQTEDDDDEPYVDHKRLEKRFSSFESKMREEIEQKADQRAKSLLENYQKEQWLKSNSDFAEVMNHAQTFADRDPELAETILQMPDSFERQKLVYKTIKAMGLHKKEEPKASIQDTIEKNRRSPYYQPSGVGSAPYDGAGDFSSSGQKNAYDKMKELQKRLRL